MVRSKYTRLLAAVKVRSGDICLGGVYVCTHLFVRSSYHVL